MKLTARMSAARVALKVELMRRAKPLTMKLASATVRQVVLASGRLLTDCDIGWACVAVEKRAVAAAIAVKICMMFVEWDDLRKH